MRLLLDTHFLVWTALGSDRISSAAYALIGDPNNDLFFSVASIWEIAIKNALGRPDLPCDPAVLRRQLMDNGYEEIPITGIHAVAAGSLPPIHKDPFDRLLVAQALTEGVTLLTVDTRIAQYPAPVRRI